MRGAATYVQLIQRKVETLTHQKWGVSKMVDVLGGFLWKEMIAFIIVALMASVASRTSSCPQR